MSAWEGSEWQAELERTKVMREAEIARIQRENPWLSRQDCEEWQRKLEEARRPRPKCCPCHGREAGIVRHPAAGAEPGALGPCRCDCHKKRIR